MAFPKAEVQGSFGDQFKEDSVQEHRLGMRMEHPDGRAYRYCQNVATAVAGRLYQSPVRVTNHTNENPFAAAAKGATSVTVDVAAAPALNIFRDGFLVDETNGKTYSIAGNTAADPTVLTLNEALDTDLATGDVVSMFKSPYRDVIIKTAAVQDAPSIGVACAAYVATRFCWFQSYGICAVLAEDSLALGESAVASPVNDAGAVAAKTTTSGEDQTVGSVYEIGSDGTIATIFLLLG